MKQSLFHKNLISQKGSVTVMALLFVLFLAIVGAGWVALMAQENNTATADEDVLKSTYAAEAGLKRAMMELRADNDKWDWLADANDKGVTKANFMDVTTGSTSTEENIPRYEVYITYPDSSNNVAFVKNSGIPTSTGATHYTVYSIGKYKGTQKAIKQTVNISQ